MTDIIIKAYDVVDEIIKTPKFNEIKELHQKIDKLYHQEIQAFENAKLNYQKVMDQGGTYHPDYKEVIQKLSQTKKELYEQPEIKRYLELELELETELNEFLNLLSKTISDHVPAPNKFGMIKKKEAVAMYTNRISYVAIYHGKHVLNKLKNLPVDITYISNKQNYAVIFFDKTNEQNIVKQMKNVKGLKHFGPSQTYDESLNF